MDPDETYQTMMDTNEDLAERYWASDDLLGWISKGGYLPDAMEDEGMDHGEAWDWLVEYRQDLRAEAEHFGVDLS